MANTKTILRKLNDKVETQSADSKVEEEVFNKMKREADKWEEEKYKDELTKSHERYRRKQKHAENAMSIEELIKPPKKITQKPGTYFHGTLRKLAEEFKDIKTMTYYMTIGQLVKYKEEDNQLYNVKTGKLAYDEKTEECFEK